MGPCLSGLKELFRKLTRRYPKIVLIGVGGAGKTSILYKMKLKETIRSIPTIGFNMENVETVSGIHFTIWDVGARKNMRPLYRHYFDGSQGLIYVVDSADEGRFAEARNELQCILLADETAGVPLLLLANKQDEPGARSPAEVAGNLGVTQLQDRRWHVEGTSAMTGKGLEEALVELSILVKDHINIIGERRRCSCYSFL